MGGTADARGELNALTQHKIYGLRTGDMSGVHGHSEVSLSVESGLG